MKNKSQGVRLAWLNKIFFFLYSFFSSSFLFSQCEALSLLDLEKSEKIKKTKAFKLNLTNEKIPDDFITRQLNETQYISRKAKEILTILTEVDPADAQFKKQISELK